MNGNQLEDYLETNQAAGLAEQPSTAGLAAAAERVVSLEAEIPEVLYRGMKDFIGGHPQWDQYRVMSSALANFLFQNGCEERAVTERYLNDLFSRQQP